MSPTLLCPQCNASFIPPPTFPSVEQALHSNVLPSNEERSLAHGILEQERYQLKLYDEELDRLDGIAKKLREERDGLARRIRLREGWSRSSASGIQRLPAEALAEIFSHLCSASDYTLSIVGKHRDNKDDVDYQELSAPPLTLSQVSHYWRKVAFSCPALWSSIEVDLTGPSSDHEIVLSTTSDHEIVLSTYFKNAASRSLDITIRGPDSDLEYDLGENGPTILETIFSQSFRFEAFQIFGFCLLRELLAGPKRPLPLLRRFETDVAIAGNLVHWLVESLGEAPLFDTFSAPLLDTINAPFAPLPYNQIKCFTVQRASGYWFWDGPLRKCSNLQMLVIRGFNDFKFERIDMVPLELPSLRYLSIEATSLRGNSPLPELKFPNLCQLELTKCRWPSNVLMNILPSCSSTLQQLTIRIGPEALFNYAGSLGSLSCLTRFNISFQETRHSNGKFTKPLLSLLTIPDLLHNTASVFLPSLTFLTISIDDGVHLLTEETGHLIVNMLLSRGNEGVSRHEESIKVSILANAFFDFGWSSWKNDKEKSKDLSALHRVLGITNAAPLDPDLKLQINLRYR
ncbi:hypothetical protein L218DRAFT_990955 [Marasmius fiardii PR-910]|nr:hypothetical protein L218DRAFT_990955 [Marasmius fiardii PR-910]